MGAKKGCTNGFKIGHIPKNFKKEGVGYGSLHTWVRNHKPHSSFCEECKIVTDALDASSINHTYERDISKWRWLCRKCHLSGDSALRPAKDKCRNGHSLSTENSLKDNRGSVICKQCKALCAKRQYQKNKEKIIARVNEWRKKQKQNLGMKQ